jgi:anti-anti-sigma regulatory factor
VAAPDPPALRIAAETDGSTTLLRLAGELDLATADQLREQVRMLSLLNLEEALHIEV